MFICRLFHHDRPFEQIEARFITEGETTVGRDADWALPDADGVLSRVHLILVVEADRLFVCDRSTNGTYLADGERVPRDQPRELALRDTVHVGALSILVDAPAAGVDDTVTSLQFSSPVLPAAQETSGGFVAPVHRDISLIEAFCEGAKLDASALSSEDPQDLMRRVGAIYQQTILGLSALMAERSRLKGEYDPDRTTISAASNNPFKWTPARKLAQDLLCRQDVGFLSDAEAVQASFEDLRSHVNALSQASDTVINDAIQSLSPEAIEAEAKTQSSLLRSRQTVCWEILVRRHATLSRAGQAPNSVSVDAYDRVAGGMRD